MATKKVPPPAWFKIEAYARTEALDFEGWRTQLGNRTALKDFVGEERALWFFDERFKKLQEAPFYDIELDLTFPLKAAYPMTFGQLKLLDSRIDDNTGFYESCDDALTKAAPSLSHMQAHITVDLNASITQLKADFVALVKPMLEKKREAHPQGRGAGITKTVLKSWHEHKILPYIDLWLWYQRQGEEMPSQGTLSRWLYKEGLGDKVPGDNWMIRQAEEKAMEALESNTLWRLALAK